MKQIIYTFIAVLILTCTVSASYDINARVSDGAGLLTEEQLVNLKSQINNIIDKCNFDAVIVTVNSLNGKKPVVYADDYFDYNGFGFGSDRDGALFLVSMEDRDWYISTSGKGIQAITDARINEIKSKVVPYLSNGNYYGAFTQFLSMTEGYLENPDTVTNNKTRNLIGVWIAAFVIALAAVLIMGAQLKTAHPKQLANDYVKSGSFKLTHKRDFFINTHTSRTPRPKDTGGSGVHTGSSGRSHGGGGGKF